MVGSVPVSAPEPGLGRRSRGAAARRAYPFLRIGAGLRWAAPRTRFCGKRRPFVRRRWRSENRTRFCVTPKKPAERTRFCVRDRCTDRGSRYGISGSVPVSACSRLPAGRYGVPVSAAIDPPKEPREYGSVPDSASANGRRPYPFLRADAWLAVARPTAPARRQRGKDRRKRRGSGRNATRAEQQGERKRPDQGQDRGRAKRAARGAARGVARGVARGGHGRREGPRATREARGDGRGEERREGQGGGRPNPNSAAPPQELGDRRKSPRHKNKKPRTGRGFQRLLARGRGARGLTAG